MVPMKVATNIDSYNVAKLLLAQPDIKYILGLATGAEKGKPIIQAYKDKYLWASHFCISKGIGQSFHLNANHAVVSDDSPKYPPKAVDAKLIPSNLKLGSPAPIDPIKRPNVIIQQYDLSTPEKRSMLADIFIATCSQFPLADLSLDGCCNNRIANSALPWRLTETCDFLSKIRQRLPADRKLSINISGILSAWKPEEIVQISEVLGGTNKGYICFEQTTTNAEGAWNAINHCDSLMKKGVTPILIPWNSFEPTVIQFIAGLGLCAIAV